jgi:hypothetical protein
MTRLELLTLVVRRARSNGFEFRRWYTGRLGVPWISEEAALILLDSQRRYYSLLFSHEFAEAFWKAGEEITFLVPEASFRRRMADGTIQTVTRKPFTRRSSKKGAWKFHLKEMAAAEDPLRHIRKYLNIEDELIDDPHAEGGPIVPAVPVKSARKLLMERPTRPPGRPEKPILRPLPTGTPAFLKRPYFHDPLKVR